MEKFKITFWKTESIEENSIIRDNDPFITSAIVIKTTEKTREIYHIVLIDIGLRSLFGEFDLVRENKLWQTSDEDSQELRLLKISIIEAIELQLK